MSVFNYTRHYDVAHYSNPDRGLSTQLYLCVVHALRDLVEMSRQSDPHLLQVHLSQLHALTNVGDSMMLEGWDIAVHLDSSKPFIY